MRHRLLAAALFIAASGAAVGAGTISVAQRGLLLSREAATISRGDRIVFQNQDDVIHNIHIFGPDADDDIDLGLQKPGVPLSYTFDKPGRVKVRCNIHPSVRMTVTVK
ncbi:MAG: plastocyanin/azurin family copper-binding protein [Methylocystis sp.]